MINYNLINFSKKCHYKFSCLIKKFTTKTNQVLNKKLAAISSIEMILILLVLVGVIVIFRAQIISIINSVFSSIRDQIDAF